VTTSTQPVPGPRLAIGTLPGWRRPLAVVAHPDDESFGLGALLSAFVDAGAEPAVLCFTHGEASTLHAVPGDLRQLRADESRSAAQALAVRDVELLEGTDGALAAADQERLAASGPPTTSTSWSRYSETGSWPPSGLTPARRSPAARSGADWNCSGTPSTCVGCRAHSTRTACAPRSPSKPSQSSQSSNRP
jgi:hypothetical protein